MDPFPVSAVCLSNPDGPGTICPDRRRAGRSNLCARDVARMHQIMVPPDEPDRDKRTYPSFARRAFAAVCAALALCVAIGIISASLR